MATAARITATAGAGVLLARNTDDFELLTVLIRNTDATNSFELLGNGQTLGSGMTVGAATTLPPLSLAPHEEFWGAASPSVVVHVFNFSSFSQDD